MNQLEYLITKWDWRILHDFKFDNTEECIQAFIRPEYRVKHWSHYVLTQRNFKRYPLSERRQAAIRKGIIEDWCECLRFRAELAFGIRHGESYKVSRWIRYREKEPFFFTAPFQGTRRRLGRIVRNCHKGDY